MRTRISIYILYIRACAHVHVKPHAPDMVPRCRGLNSYQYHFEVHLGHLILWLYDEYGTNLLVAIEAPLQYPKKKSLAGRPGQDQPLDKLGALRFVAWEPGVQAERVSVKCECLRVCLEREREGEEGGGREGREPSGPHLHFTH